MGKSAKRRPEKKANGKLKLEKAAGRPEVAATARDEETPAAVLDRIWSVVVSRRAADPDVSHSARLLSRGTAKIAQKFGEEAVECLIEATRGNRDALIAESADVLYHLIVMWVDGGIRPDDVWSELHRREGLSGIAERAARVQSLPARIDARTKKIP
jgi:phosphoribosyl-ATP pyrophosphohydrolase